MENHVVCPRCKAKITHNSVIDDAAKGEGADTQSLRCECGERITYWQATAQLRKQKTLSWRLQNWVRNLSPRRS